jgi:uncharacterized lipoprotein NlpE involved in copper resistance
MTLAGAMLFGCDTGAPTSGASSTDAAGGTTAGTPAQAGTASVTWTAPAADVNGATNVAGYRIYYGEDAGSLTHVVDVDGAEAVKFTINDLTPGVWYFAIADYNAEKVESPLSGIVQVTI